MTLKAFPKINLYLKIIGKDSSAYHLLESRFVLVKSGVHDEIHIEAIDSSKDEICGAFGCDAESSSIALALRSLRARYDFPRVRIEVQKRIPIGAGLGGGSADAGVVIKALMEEFGLGAVESGGANLDSRALRGAESSADSSLDSRAKSGGANLDSSARKTRSMIAKEVGADVAFFVEGCECAEVEGRGEVITPLALARDDLREFEIYTPAIRCDTRAVYRQYAKMIESKEITYSPKMRGALGAGKIDSSKVDSGALDSNILDFSALSNREILSIAQKQGDAPSVLNALNDLFLPASVLYPELLDVKKELGDGWYFSGSGSSFFRPMLESKSAPATPESKSAPKACL